MTVRETIDVNIAHGMHPGVSADDMSDKILGRLVARRSMQVEMEMRPGLFVQIATEPMANGGSMAMFEDVTEKRQNEAQIIFMARHDALTGLPNRTLFQEHMAAMLDKGARGPAVWRSVSRSRPLQGGQRHPGPPGG